MKIAIDARLYGLKHAGIGRYILNLVNKLADLDKENHYTIITNSDTKIEKRPKNSTIIRSDILHYSLREQFIFLQLINSLDVDLVHFPHFNVPIMCKKKYVVTIHDLLWHEKIGFNVTTLHPLKYLLKYWGYRFVIRNAVTRASHVITPANVVKQAVIKTFSKDRKHVSVTYEAAQEHFFQPTNREKDLKKYGLPKTFFIYTGSLYPHKNVNILIDVLEKLPKEFSLVIASSRNIFSKRFKSLVKQRDLSSRVQMLGFVPDTVLPSLYQKPLALLLPSQSEGFGLTGLEAMAASLPVICSKHSVMKEIYSSAAIYVDTTNSQEIADEILKLHLNSKLQKEYIIRGQHRAKDFSWETMAQQTIEIYQNQVK